MRLPLSFDDARTIKALGIQWHPGRDIFTFQFNIPEQRKATKRRILSVIARLYYPMGWISPCAVTGKLLMQEIWKQGQVCNSELPEWITSAWHTHRTDLDAVNTLEIHRWLSITHDTRIELHGFCDASEKAYAAAVYIRAINGGSIKTNLVFAKTRVAPLKTISLARLELCGAVLLAKLLVRTKEMMDLKETGKYAWCDSQITLAWIKSAPYTRTAFVANRIAEIQQPVDPSRWNYIVSEDNPADLASRGISPRDLPAHHQWWHGPEMLHKFRESTHLSKDVPTTKLETKRAPDSRSKNILICGHVITSNELLSRYTTLPRLIRIIAYCLRFISNCASGRSSSCTGPLSVEEISSSRMRLIAVAQREVFAEDIERISNGSTVSKDSKLARLSPIVDDHKIMRVGGRLENADLPYTQRHPIILPADSALTDLIIQDAHQMTLHGGQQLMPAVLRQEFRILKVKTQVKNCIHRCPKCYRHMGTPMQQMMADLPSARVNQARPFQSTGVDYAGPGRVAAVHLELVSDYSTHALLAAFKRLTAHRGICTDLYSDCGTNFQGAAGIMRQEQSHHERQWTTDVAKQLQDNGTAWHFNPPAAPHFGGLWGAGVKSMKHHLRRVIGHHSLTFEEYATVLAQVEACLNSRPLCPTTEDVDDLTILTPGHFLIGASPNTVPEKDLSNVKPHYLNRWQLLQKIHQDFWKRWKSEYLVRLQQRTKRLTSNLQLKIGDLVLLPEEQTPPTLWRLGRIEALHPGNYGKMRVVTIKTATTRLTRPVAKLCLLPMIEQ